MLIRELEGKTGLERATIRFYEREGFIQPVRHENGYREYSVEDCENLLKIKLLRKLGISLERIQDLQQGRADFSEALEDQIRQLEDQIQAAERAKNVCERMRCDRVSYRTLDAAYYLKILEEPALGGVKSSTAPVPEFHAKLYLKRHPVRRYVARAIDLSLLTSAVSFLFFVVLRIRFEVELLQNILQIACVFVWVPLSAFLLSRFGTTPGKWVMGLSVLSCNGNRMTFEDAKDREWNVLRNGLGFYLPVWTYIRSIKSYKEYIATYENSWYGDSEIVYEDWTKLRRTFAAVLAAIFVILTGFSGFDILKPSYRGENITISQFSKNYNYIYELLYDDQGELLTTTGEWLRNPNLKYDGLELSPEFQYELEGEYIRAIRYETKYPYLYQYSSLPQQCVAAAVCMAASQNDIGFFELLSFISKTENALEESEFINRSGEIVTENIKVHWSEESDMDDSMNMSITCKFEVSLITNE